MHRLLKKWGIMLYMKCPHCLHLFHEQFKEARIGENEDSSENFESRYQICPGCKKSIVFLSVQNFYGHEIENILVYPRSVARNPLPPEVDDENVVNDYNEASKTIDVSPKASAALSRRCLQYILREKVGVKKDDLSKEIQELLDSDKLPSDIADNLDAIRNIGNFGTHPMKSTSTGEIVEVESEEAEWNLEVLEQLIDFYYTRPAISHKKREKLNEKLSDAGKPILKKGDK